MDNLINIISTLFRKVNPEDLFFYGGAVDEKSILNYLLRQHKEYIGNHSEDDWNNIISLVGQKWLMTRDLDETANRYNLLLHFTKDILIEDHDQPGVQFKHLLRWRMLSYEIGEDLLTCSTMAYRDVVSRRHRDFFAWKPTIASDNSRLKAILSEGVAENHFHLKGSAPVFEISWISLMNQPNERSEEWAAFTKKGRLNEATHAVFNYQNVSLESLVKFAAVLRLQLFAMTSAPSVAIDPLIQNIDKQNLGSKFDDVFLLLPIMESEKSAFTASNMCLKFPYRDNKYTIDYAIPSNIHASNLSANVILTGERILLYNCFRNIFGNGENHEVIAHNLYIYLLIKSKLREELVQLNNKVGFGNFLSYQDRKEVFIKSGSIYEVAFYSMAVDDTSKNNRLLSFETRIAPKNNANNLLKSIIVTDKLSAYQYFDNVTDKLSNSLSVITGTYVKPEPSNHHTIHFIKHNPDERYRHDIRDLILTVIPRNNVLRQNVKREAIAIQRLREFVTKRSERIWGIDAASSEFQARPEVFAQAFRYLKGHQLSGRNNHLKNELGIRKLGATYHVGEDFFDIIDGLRAIDEVLIYLDFQQGDRIGHALAMGISAEQYFRFKGKTLAISKQDYLDNIVWVIFKSMKFGIKECSNEVLKLKIEFHRLFNEIYLNNLPTGSNVSFTQLDYHDAWLLRGDDPERYLNDWETADRSRQNLTYWDRCGLNCSISILDTARENRNARLLYHMYHFNANVKNAGSLIEEVKISQEYIRLVDKIQHEYRHFFSKKGIAIECNPTSNYLISTFKRYADHPIKTFYNLGLTYDPQENKNCPQIMVSINTDDQGIFSTSLENEYALLALGLEKETNADGTAKYSPAMIYDWLDRIRKMGLEMSFQNK